MGLLYCIYFALLAFDFFASLFFLKTAVIKLLSVLLFISLIIDALAAFNNFKNFLFYALFTPVEYILVSLILTRHLKQRTVNHLVILTIILFTVLCFFSIRVNETDEYPSSITSVEDLLTTIWCLVCFFYIEPLEEVSIIKRPIFWITLGFFIYNLGTIGVNAIYNTWITNQKDLATYIHKIINVSFNILLYILLAIGIIGHKWDKKYIQQ